MPSRDSVVISTPELASAWAAHVQAHRLATVAWLSLDPYDDELARFWTAVVAALQTLDPALGADPLPFLSAMTPASMDAC